MQARGFTSEDFAKFHPGGQLGRNLRMKVADAFHIGREVAWVQPSTSLKEVMIAMTQSALGAALIVDKDSRLLGLITMAIYAEH